MDKILVTGGLGFIGSHTVVELQDKGYEVLIIDDLSNSEIATLSRIESISGKRPLLEQLDLKNEAEVERFFNSHRDIKGVIHFAASKAVGESVDKPLEYYENNINALVYVLKAIRRLPQKNFIFSSSCTVYGEADKMPITENAAVKPAESPYGNTKQIGEEIISDLCRAESGFKAYSLRYFNPIGAHESGKLGELPIGVPANLIPFITQTAAGIRKELSVFGNDYNTPDGTCIRDYIHVVDLARAHIVALERLMHNSEDTQNYDVFNLGTGKGNSVLEVIEAFESVTQQKLNYKITDRRQGDIVQAYADTTKANEVLGWKAEKSLKTALLHAWQWQQQLEQINN